MTRLLNLTPYILAPWVILVLLNFPYDTDRPLTDADLEETREYYADAYKEAPTAPEVELSEYETRYLEIATVAARHFDIEGQVRHFVDENGLKDKRVLDIGSGRGYLQDIVDDYTGLDISSSVERFYHKDFVLGSATAMPFEDNRFDGAWSIWVQEHVPNPEQFLRETRRVVKDGGVIFLHTAWSCTPWAAQGYEVRPYSDFDLAGKLVKATIPIRAIGKGLAAVPVRIVRALSASSGPSTLRYHRLQPNYDIYWQNDSDAVNNIDVHEAMLWFTSRGDECLSCDPPSGSVTIPYEPLIIRVHK